MGFDPKKQPLINWTPVGPTQGDIVPYLPLMTVMAHPQILRVISEIKPRSVFQVQFKETHLMDVGELYRLYQDGVILVNELSLAVGKLKKVDAKNRVLEVMATQNWDKGWFITLISNKIEAIKVISAQ